MSDIVFFALIINAWIGGDLVHRINNLNKKDKKTKPSPMTMIILVIVLTFSNVMFLLTISNL